MLEIFALIVAGGLSINWLSGALAPNMVQVCVPAIVEGQQATVCRSVKASEVKTTTEVAEK